MCGGGGGSGDKAMTKPKPRLLLLVGGGGTLCYNAKVMSLQCQSHESYGMCTIALSGLSRPCSLGKLVIFYTRQIESKNLRKKWIV